MFLTAAEAREKWCPFVRTAAAGDKHLWNRSKSIIRKAFGNEEQDNWCRCLAGECCAWRWTNEPGETLIEGIRRHREENRSTLVDAKGYVETHPEYLKRPTPDRGYCGLGGRPVA